MTSSRPRTETPFFTAPPGVVWLAGILVAAHAVQSVVPRSIETVLFYWLALIPARFDLMVKGMGHADAYGPVGLLIASLGHVLLHGDWMHVLLNAGMLLALGAPVARRHGIPRFLIIFGVSAIGGALLFFLVRDADSAPAIGASGGVSGIFAGAFLLMASPVAGWSTLLSRSFVNSSLAFLLINIALYFTGPSLFGAGIAWDAHIGGYIAGALAMAAFGERR